MNHRNPTLKAEIFKILSRTDWTSCKTISGRLTIGYDRPLYYLNQLMKEGVVERKAETFAHTDCNSTGRRYVYRAKAAEAAIPEVPPGVAGAPYRDLRLTENLVDYDRTLHSFQALCMMVRK